MTLLVKPIFNAAEDNVIALGELTPTDTAEIVGPLVVGSDSEFNSTGALKIPVGADAERPATPIKGMIRVNNVENNFEYFDGTKWKSAGKDGILVDEAPPNAKENELWFESDSGKTYIQYKNPDGTLFWVESNSAPMGEQGPQGPTVVSKDAGNYSKLGTDGFIYTPTPISKVLQVVYGYDAGSTIAYSSGVYVNLNNTYINITPKSTNSKIIVEVSYDSKLDSPIVPNSFIANTFIAESTVLLSTTLRTFCTYQPQGNASSLYCTGSQAGVFNNTALTTRGFHLVGTTQPDCTYYAGYMNWIITEVAN
jgi:hypothetical protein